jgi:hypothetical protein
MTSNQCGNKQQPEYTEKSKSELIFGKIITSECPCTSEFHEYQSHLEMFFRTNDLNWCMARCMYCGQPLEAKGYWSDWEYEINTYL